MQKLIKLIIATFALLFIITLLGILYIKRSTTTTYNGELKLAGLHSPVNIYRDKNGVPHINASNDADLYFALGFTHAQDRFWQMEFQRRVVTGTLSELFGKQTIPVDKFVRTFGFYKAAASAWPALNAQTQSNIQSYTDGVNAFIKLQHFPIEIQILHYHPQTWTVIDSIAWQKMMAWNLQNHSWNNKINYALAQQNNIHNYFPTYPTTSAVILPDSPLRKELNTTSNEGIGSNGWVVSGKLTTTHQPLLANDMHLGLTAPNLWYMVELHSPTLHVIGVTIPGVPGVVVGHNDHIAWGVTNGYNDASELYELNASDKITTHKEVIKVRDNPDVEFNVLTSAYGPIINDITPDIKSKQFIALKWPAFSPGDTTAQSFMKLDYAKNWEEFSAALKDFVTPTQNFLYADIEGNIGYYYPGQLPIRNWQSLTPTSTSNQWQGYIPFAKLPHAFNPSIGYVASANNKAVGDNYPYTLNARWPVPPYRIDRIVQMLQQQPLTISHMAAMQNDVQSAYWLQLKPYLLATQPLDANSKTAIQLLQHWDGDTDITSSAATVFAYWLNNFNDLIPEPLRNPNKHIEPLYLYQLLKSGLSQKYLQLSLKQAMEQLVKDHGADPVNWEWGKFHRAIFVGDGVGKIPVLGNLWNKSIPSPGGDYTIDDGTYDPVSFEQSKGATFREILDLSNLENSLYIMPMGQSGNPFSTHYQDLLRKWRDGKYIKIHTIQSCNEKAVNCLQLS